MRRAVSASAVRTEHRGGRGRRRSGRGRRRSGRRPPAPAARTPAPPRCEIARQMAQGPRRAGGVVGRRRAAARRRARREGVVPRLSAATDVRHRAPDDKHHDRRPPAPARAPTSPSATLELPARLRPRGVRRRNPCTAPAWSAERNGRAAPHAWAPGAVPRGRRILRRYSPSTNDGETHQRWRRSARAPAANGWAVRTYAWAAQRRWRTMPAHCC